MPNDGPATHDHPSASPQPLRRSENRERHRSYLRALCAEILARLEEPLGPIGDPQIHTLAREINYLELSQRIGFRFPPLRYDRDKRVRAREVEYWTWFDPAGASCAIPFRTVHRDSSGGGKVRYINKDNTEVWQQLATEMRRWIRALDGMANAASFPPRSTLPASTKGDPARADPLVRTLERLLTSLESTTAGGRFKVDDAWRELTWKLNALAKYDLGCEFDCVSYQGLVAEPNWRLVVCAPGQVDPVECPIAPDHHIEPDSVQALISWTRRLQDARIQSLASVSDRPKGRPSVPAIDHAPDFSWLSVGDKRFSFTKPRQRQVIEMLFAEWERGGDGCGLTLAGIAEKLGNGRSTTRARIDHWFSGHEALGTILGKSGRDQWALCLRPEQ